MTELEIVEVGAGDPDGLAEWHRVRVVSDRHDLGEHAPLWTLEELAATLASETARRTRLFTGRVDGEAVALGRLDLPLTDNLDSAEVHVVVRPDRRRSGRGGAMLTHLESLAGDEGRRRLDAQAAWPYDGSPDGRGQAGVEFALGNGYAFGIGEVQRELSLPVPDDLLRELAVEAAPHHADYELRSWSGPVPESLVVSWLELATTLMTEAPMGEMEREPEAVDVAAWRTMEARLAAQGRTAWHAVALDAGGRVVAYSQLIETAPDNPFYFQWGTLVHRGHRGHRLGQAVKALNHRAMQEGTDVAGRRVVTWNAEVNDHMIGINERLGFRPTARGGEFQKRLGA